MIQAQQLFFSYSKKPLFRGLDLQLSKGHITGLLGRNGEGKTTLFKLISGVLLPSSGQLMVQGYVPAHRTAPFLQQVYLLPEEFAVPNVKTFEYFDVIGNFYPNYSSAMALELLEEFDLKPDMKLGRMSHGQRKKAMIALALAVQTPILLMDEPTNGLDIPSKSLFRKLMARYATPEQTVVISTHQVRDLENTIDHLLLLDQNEIICNESIERLASIFKVERVDSSNAAYALYNEPSPMGPVGLFASSSAIDVDEGSFSIELFFNAMVSNAEAMNKHLSSI